MLLMYAALMAMPTPSLATSSVAPYSAPSSLMTTLPKSFRTLLGLGPLRVSVEFVDWATAETFGRARTRASTEIEPSASTVRPLTPSPIRASTVFSSYKKPSAPDASNLFSVGGFPRPSLALMEAVIFATSVLTPRIDFSRSLTVSTKSAVRSPDETWPVAEKALIPETTAGALSTGMYPRSGTGLLIASLRCDASTSIEPATSAVPSRWALVVPPSTPTAMEIAILPSRPATAVASARLRSIVSALTYRLPPMVRLASGDTRTCESDCMTVTAMAMAVPASGPGLVEAFAVFAAVARNVASLLVVIRPSTWTSAVVSTTATAMPTILEIVGDALARASARACTTRSRARISASVPMVIVAFDVATETAAMSEKESTWPMIDCAAESKMLSSVEPARLMP